MRIGQAFQGVQNSSPDSSKIPHDKLRPGDTVKAEVISSNERGLTLKMEDGTVVSAQRASPGALPQGEQLNFTITSRAGGQITVALSDPSVPNQIVDAAKLLRAFGVAVTQQSSELIREMLSGGMTPTRESVGSLGEALARFPNLTPQQAVFMAREGIPITQQNISQFQEFLQHQNLVGDQLQHILTLLDENPVQSDVQTNTPVLISQAEGASLTGTVETQPDIQTQQAPVTNQNESIGSDAVVSQPSEQPVSQTAERPSHAYFPPNTNTENTAETAMHVAQPQQSESETQAAVHAPTEQVDGTQKSEKPDDARIAQSQRPLSEEVPEHSGMRAPETKDAPEKSAVSIQKESIQSPEKAVESSVPDQHEADKNTANLEKLISSIFKKVDPDHAHKLPRDMNAKNVLQELSEAITVLREKLESMPESTQAPLRQAVAELEQNVRFMQQLNNYTPVVSIPLQWGNERTTAELYVFNDSKGKKRIDPQNATVFLSLMTSNTGRVETLIKVLGKNVECDFSLELEETIEPVENSMQALAALLEEQGYHLARTSVKGADKASDLFDVNKIREENKQRYFFDRTI